MSMIRTLTVLAALAVGSAAVAEPAKKTDKPADKVSGDDKAKRDALPKATVERFLAFFDQLVAIAVANKDDCTKMANAVNAHVDANQAILKEIAEAKAQNKEPPQSARDHVMKKTNDELTPAMRVKCSQDKAVMAAFMRMRTNARTTK